MDDLFNHVSHLALLSSDSAALEKFSLKDYVSDTLSYYFKRFTKNLTHVFDDFVSSEIEDVNARNKRTLDNIFRQDLSRYNKLLVPIPKGMVKPYLVTISTLMDVLKDVGISTVKDDVIAVSKEVGHHPVEKITLPVYEKSSFEKAKETIGSLFSKYGLTHNTVDHAFVSMEDVVSINVRLRDVTAHYTDLIAINKAMREMEKHHSEQGWQKNDREAAEAMLMPLAYRLSILAVAMEHIQAIEHQFAETLRIFVKSFNHQ